MIETCQQLTGDDCFTLLVRVVEVILWYTSHWPKQDLFLRHTPHSSQIGRGSLLLVDWALLQREGLKPSVKHSSLEIHILFNSLSGIIQPRESMKCNPTNIQEESWKL